MLNGWLVPIKVSKISTSGLLFRCTKILLKIRLYLGYYVHLSTYAEVREEVLHYIPVMARPMVLNANQKPNPAWSPVYADVTDPKLTNWLWVNRQRNTQRDRYLIFSKYKDLISPNEIDKKFVHQQKLVSTN